jgi:hypothetical protein
VLAEPDIGQRLADPLGPLLGVPILNRSSGSRTSCSTFQVGSGERPVICSPPTEMFPVSGPAGPSSSRIVVVLPEPDGEANY